MLSKRHKNGIVGVMVIYSPIGFGPSWKAPAGDVLGQENPGVDPRPSRGIAAGHLLQRPLLWPRTTLQGLQSKGLPPHCCSFEDREKVGKEQKVAYGS